MKVRSTVLATASNRATHGLGDRTRRVVGLALLGCALALPALLWTGPSASAAPDEPASTAEPEKSVDADRLYFGNAKNWSKPAEVDVDAVFAEIEEYKAIVEKGLTVEDPKYSILMAKASRKFSDAVSKAAKTGGYDLVAGIGAVKGVSDVPVITADVVSEL